MQSIASHDSFSTNLSAKKRIIHQSSEILQGDLSLGYNGEIAVKNDVLLVGESELSHEFSKLAHFRSIIRPEILAFSGNLGDFSALCDGEILKISQIIFFAHNDFLESATFAGKTAPLGIHIVSDYEDLEALSAAVSGFVGEWTFEKTILFDANVCDYANREKTSALYCHACADICPTSAIVRDDVAHELRLSNIDCILCGRCVGACPSGAMQKANASLANITKMARLYAHNIPLIVSENDKNKALDFSADSTLAPFILPNLNILSEAYILSIIQESGNLCVIVGGVESSVIEAIEFINALYTRLFGVKVAYYFSDFDFAPDEIPLKNTHIERYFYDIEGEIAKEVLSNRIKFLVKDNDYGILAHKKSAFLRVEDNCTLCMSCVEACKTHALMNSKDNFSLLANPSLCTACGYCADICPENAIALESGAMSLKSDFFAHKQVAHDEPFSCVECGSVFASAKSVAKVERILLPVFSDDEVKKHSIYCCADCKVKAMFRG